MKKLTTLNTKLLLVATAAVAALALAAMWEFARAPLPRPGPALSPVPGEAGLQLFDPARDLPAVAFDDGAGGTLGLDAFRGKVVLVNFWATWCEPCKREMPSLLRLQERLGDKDFRVIAVSGDRGGKTDVESYAAQNKLRGLKFLYDPMLSEARKLGVTGLPTSILVGRNGRELGRAEGALEWDSDAVAKTIQNEIRQGAADGPLTGN
jgi:thiol-disulfide isomerase/thioredoxin